MGRARSRARLAAQRVKPAGSRALAFEGEAPDIDEPLPCVDCAIVVGRVS